MAVSAVVTAATDMMTTVDRCGGGCGDGCDSCGMAVQTAMVVVMMGTKTAVVVCRVCSDSSGYRCDSCGYGCV